MRSLSRFLWLLAALAALAAAVDPQQLRAEAPNPEPIPATEAGAAPEAELQPGDAMDATLSAALSGCGLCQQTGYCERAFRNSPGQFCLAMASGAPCCCPEGAQCAASPFDCRCRAAAAYGYPNAQPYAPHAGSSSSSGSSFSTVLLVLLLLCCVCCCWLPSHKRHREREETVQFAQPAYADGHYGSGQPAYGYPGYPTAPAYEQHSHRGGGEALAAGAAGAVGGLGLGALLGSWMNRERPNSSASFFGGDTGGGYSQTFAGDTGGGYSSTSQGSYTFSGDTGGGGGTFSGDS